MATYLRTPDAAKYLGIGQSTLERKRIDGTGPKYRQLGARIVTYATEDLDEWASGNVKTQANEHRAFPEALIQRVSHAICEADCGVVTSNELARCRDLANAACSAYHEFYGGVR